MRSTCSGVASRSCTSRSASSENGRLQRFTRKPGPSAASITRRPIAVAELAGALERLRPELLAGDDLHERASAARGLKKCIPTTRSGRGTPAAIAVTLSDEVLVARTHPVPTCSASAGEQGRA